MAGDQSKTDKKIASAIFLSKYKFSSLMDDKNICFMLGTLYSKLFDLNAKYLRQDITCNIL